MGESHLSGVEFRDSGHKEQKLLAALQDLVGRQVHMFLKNDEITVLVDLCITVTGITRHENRIETGHLTLDDVYFELTNVTGPKVYFSLAQFKNIEYYGKSILFCFDTYRWMITLT